MPQFRTLLIAAAGGLLVTHGSAVAQVGPPLMGGGVGPWGPNNPMSRPVLSPYLNITGFGNPAINYYNQTNWQFDQRQFDRQMLNQAPGALAAPAPELDDLIPRLPQTGHLAGFHYYSPYFGPANTQRGAYFPYNPMVTGLGGATTTAMPTTRGAGATVPAGRGPKR